MLSYCLPWDQVLFFFKSFCASSIFNWFIVNREKISAKKNLYIIEVTLFCYFKSITQWHVEKLHKSFYLGWGVNFYFWELIIKKVFLFPVFGKKMQRILNDSQHIWSGSRRSNLLVHQASGTCFCWRITWLMMSKPKQRIGSTAIFNGFFLFLFLFIV